MIEVPAAVRAVIDSGSFTYYVRASAWLGDQLLAEDVPIDDAAEETDTTLNVPERVRLTVPRYARGIDWSPTTDTHPLAAKGQTLKISLGIGLAGDQVEWFQRGEFLFTESVEREDAVDAPFQPAGTLGGTLRALIEPAVSVDLDASPADRAVPTSEINWDSDRLGAVGELLDAWPAVLRMHAQGYAEVIPDVAPTEAVRSFTNGTGGTIVTAAGRTTRDGGFSIVVATGYAADGGEVRGIAEVTSGPWAYGTGPANPLPVPFGYTSPLLTTNGQCAAAAMTVLRRKMRAAVLRSYVITCPPDPTLQAGDPVEITTDHVDQLLCTVESLGLPYSPNTMTLRVVEAI
jgi:hypothetical protein